MLTEIHTSLPEEIFDEIQRYTKSHTHHWSCKEHANIHHCFWDM